MNGTTVGVVELLVGTFGACGEVWGMAQDHEGGGGWRKHGVDLGQRRGGIGLGEARGPFPTRVSV